jgi:hypothetical protein
MFCMKIILASILSRAAVKTSGSFRGVYHCGVVEAKALRAKLVAHGPKLLTPGVTRQAQDAASTLDTTP